jgi:hypothetical protein
MGMMGILMKINDMKIFIPKFTILFVEMLFVYVYAMTFTIVWMFHYLDTFYVPVRYVETVSDMVKTIVWYGESHDKIPQGSLILIIIIVCCVVVIVACLFMIQFTVLAIRIQREWMIGKYYQYRAKRDDASSCSSGDEKEEEEVEVEKQEDAVVSSSSEV